MSLDFAIGATLEISVPDVDARIAAGYTVIRIYFASSEDGSYTLEGTTLTLVAGTYSYSYNKTSAAATDWWQYAFYGVAVGESPRSEPMPVSDIQSTKSAIRQGVGRRLRLMEGPFNPSSVTDGDTLAIAELVDLDGDTLKYCNWFARAGTQSRQVRASPNGYTPGTGKLEFRRAFSPTLDTGANVELWLARANEDPSTIVDDAMQRARKEIWWEETYYLVSATSQSEYALPRTIITPSQVKRVEIAMGNYPNEPAWAKAPANVYMDGGAAFVSLSPGVYGGVTSNQVVRVVVNRFADRMDSELDYWNVPLEWAVAEVALQALRVLTVTTGKVEDIRDWRIQQSDLAKECEEFRAVYRPMVEIVLEPPR